MTKKNPNNNNRKRNNRPKVNNQKLQNQVKGAVKQALKSLPKGTFKKAGKFMGGLVGHPTLGGNVGQALSRFTGYGDYISNNLVNTSGYDGVSVPKFGSADNGTRICHSEYLGDIASSVSFTSNRYAINPGDAKTFPWLSQIADGYEKYRFRSLMFFYRSISSEYSTTQSLGAVIAAAQYDVIDPAFSTKAVMENYYTAISTKPSNNLLFGVECKPSSTAASELYLRYSPNPPAGTDRRLYDLANFTIATQGMNATAFTAGELWVSYDVELFYPNINFSSYGTSTITYHGYTNTSSSTNLLNGMVARFNNFVGDPFIFNNNTFTLPSSVSAGVIRVEVILYGTTSATAPGNFITATASTNCTGFLAGAGGGSGSTVIPFYAGTTTPVTSGSSRVLWTGWFQVTGAAPSVTWTVAATPAGFSYQGVDFFCTLYPYDWI